MPSSRITARASLWARVVVAFLALVTVGTALVAFEAAVVAAASYGALSWLVGTVVPVAPSPAVGAVAVVLLYLAAVSLVLAAYRYERRTDDVSPLVRQVLVYAGVALVFGSVAVTFLAMMALGLPRWTFALLLVCVLAGAYPMVGLLLARDDDPERDDPPWALDEMETEEELPWVTDGATEKPYDTPSLPSLRETTEHVREGTRVAADGLYAVAGAIRTEFGAVASATRARLGPAGVAGVLALAVVALAGVAVVARTRSADALVLPLSVGFGVLLAVAHVVDAARGARRDGPVVDGLAEDLGPAVDDDRTRTLEERVSRLAAAMDVPAPTVRLRRSETATAAVVGYHPSASTLVVTTGLVERLSDRELDAVLAHELAHVANRDAAVVTALSAPRVAAGRAFYRYGPNPVAALLAGLVAATSRLAVAVVSRAREHTADDAAAAVTGDPAALAAALERLDERLAARPDEDLRGAAAPFSIVPPAREEHRFFDRTRRFVGRRLLGTHPPTERRIERLRRLADAG